MKRKVVGKRPWTRSKDGPFGPHHTSEREPLGQSPRPPRSNYGLGECLAVVSEPYRVPDRPHWFGDTAGTVVITRGTCPSAPSIAILERNYGFVSVSSGRLIVVGLHAPLSWPMSTFERFLDKLRRHLAPFPSHPTLLGDFNAKNTLCGSPRTDARRNVVEEWVAELDLRLLNSGHTNTCVKWEDKSIVVTAREAVIKHIPGKCRRILRYWAITFTSRFTSIATIELMQAALPFVPSALPQGK